MPPKICPFRGDPDTFKNPGFFPRHLRFCRQDRMIAEALQQANGPEDFNAKFALAWAPEGLWVIYGWYDFILLRDNRNQ